MAKAGMNIGWQGWLAVGASVAAIGTGVYLATRSETEDLPEDEKYSGKETKDTNISKAAAAFRANQLFNIMDGINWDNAEAFIRPFIGVNAAGIKMIVNEFGLREGTYTWTKENLYQWIAGEQEKTILVAREIWKRQGLIPPF